MIDLTFYGYGVGVVMAFWFVGCLIGLVFDLFRNNRLFPGQ